MHSNGKILLGTAPVVIANRYRDLLSEKSIKIDLAYNNSTCKTGCSHTMEMWAEEGDLATVVEFIKSENKRNFEGLDFDPEVINQVFDSSREEAQCPACATVFPTSASECPDCGLGFSIPE